MALKMPEQDDGKFSCLDVENKHKYYKSVFNKFDRDNSGDIELTELVETLKKNDNVPEHISRIVFQEADKNADGVLNKEEFEEMVQNKDFSEVFSGYVNTYMRYLLPRKKYQSPSSVPDGIYEENLFKCCPPALAMLTLSLLEFTFFIIDEMVAVNSNNQGPMSKIFTYNPHRRYEAWRFLTYMFVHAGYQHLVPNLVLQLFLGVPLEIVHRSKRILVVYFSGVIAGSLTSSIVNPRISLVGASAGVYALLTAHVGTIIMNWRDMDFPLCNLLVFVIIIALNIGMTIYNKYTLDTYENVAHSAHIGGAVAGLLVGIWILKNFTPTKKEMYIWWSALAVFIILLSIMVLMNIFWTKHFLPNA
ncbi:unnamed protein product [Phyllotreta striolata]|uniref:EF-hand domain-containing protein n=1 Tax=Phyllotreta striolata TaxID=444603 RepID=A0A9N9TS34_PHYSR|nr:unnamed protein product [Phyllotreta striolata]